MGLYLGIDPGLQCTGYAVLDPERRRVSDAGVLRTSPRRTLEQRLAELSAAFDELLAEHRVDTMAVEQLYAHYKHPRTAILMGHARGVILLAAARRDIPVVHFNATQIKKTLTGNGHAGKRQVQQAIMVTLGLARIPEPADVADAIAVALCAATHARNVPPR
jgi:crossover junction endodeoxyribonuclease RuvC